MTEQEIIAKFQPKKNKLFRYDGDGRAKITSTGKKLLSILDKLDGRLALKLKDYFGFPL